MVGSQPVLRGIVANGGDKKAVSNAPHELPSVEGLMAYANPAFVFPDQDRAGNRLVQPRYGAPGKPLERWDLRSIRVHDLSRSSGASCGAPMPNIFNNGFALASIGSLHALQDTLRRIASTDVLNTGEVELVSKALVGIPIPIGGGYTVEVLGVSKEDMFLRRAGPDNISLDDPSQSQVQVPSVQIGRRLPPAVNVHTDGDPDGRRQSVNWKQRFNHSKNTSSPMFVLNFWIPMQQPVRPLAVMDSATLDRERDQVKQAYKLPLRTDGGFLQPLEEKREQVTADNHVFLHHPSHRWYFWSHAGPQQALVFDTMSTAHGTFVLPGEDELRKLYRQLQRAVEVLQAGGANSAVSVGALTFALWPDAEQRSQLCPKPAAAQDRAAGSLPLHRLIQEMNDLVREGRNATPVLCQGASATYREDYVARVSAVLSRSARKSLEIRCSAIVRRDGGFPNTPLFDIMRAHGRMPRLLDRLGLFDGFQDLGLQAASLYGRVKIILLSFLLPSVFLLAILAGFA